MEYPHISSYIPMFNGGAVADCFFGGRGVGRLQGIDGIEDDFPFGSCLGFIWFHVKFTCFKQCRLQ